MKIALAITTACCLCFFAHSQESGQSSIRGRILLQDNSTPAAFIHLALHNAKDSSLLKGTLTDSLGNFRFEGIRKGNFLLSLSASRSGKPDFIYSITADSTGANLGTLYMQEKYTKLTEVVVQARKPFLERHLDRLTINLEGSTLTAGNSVLEAMGKLPGMYLNGNSLFFNGSADILFLVDGKGYRSGSEQSVQVLRSLRAENIEKVEIFTNPPARFDAQGATVISIVLKKDKMYSSAGAGYTQRLFPAPSENGFDYRSYSLNSNISYSIGKFRMSGILSFERSGDNFTRESVYNGLSSGYYTRDSRMTSEAIRLMGNLRVVYAPNARNEVSAHLSYMSNPETEILTDALLEFYRANGGKDSSTRTSVTGLVDYSNPELLLHYLHRFDEKGKRAVSVSAVKGGYRSSFENDYVNANTGTGATAFFRQWQDYDVDVLALKADYTLPLKDAQLDMGVKTTSLENSDKYTLPDNNLFSFDERINASYVSVRRVGKKIAYQAGLRAEHTASSGESSLLPGKRLQRNYLDVFPSFVIQWTTPVNSRVSFSASRRIVRPSYSDFNPYRYRSFYDPNVSQAGDVNLRPQYVNRYELGYVYKNFFGSLSYADRRGVRAMFALPDNGITGVKLQAVNINTGDWTALVSYNRQFKKWWQLNASGNLYYYQSFLFNSETRRSLAGFFSVNNSLQLAKKLKADASFRYISAAQAQYWRTSGYVSAGAGLSASLLRDNVTATLNLEDILGTQKVEWTYDYVNVRTVTTPVSNARLFRLSFIYRFRTGNLFQARSRQSNDFGEIRYGK